MSRKYNRREKRRYKSYETDFAEMTTILLQVNVHVEG